MGSQTFIKLGFATKSSLSAGIPVAKLKKMHWDTTPQRWEQNISLAT